MHTRWIALLLLGCGIFAANSARASDDPVVYDSDWRAGETGYVSRDKNVESTSSYSAPHNSTGYPYETNRVIESSNYGTGYPYETNHIIESKNYGTGYPYETNHVIESKNYGSGYPYERNKVIESSNYGSDYNPMHESIIDSSNF